jgi:hypothetical protein
MIALVILSLETDTAAQPEADGGISFDTSEIVPGKYQRCRVLYHAILDVLSVYGRLNQ